MTANKSEDIVIHVKGVSKTFRLPHERQNSLKSVIINLGRHKKGYEKQHVLKDISFDIKQGEFFGIVGRNGSGKSTLLKLLAGIYEPDQGDININGKLIPFIELGVGFNHELTGRENVFLNGALLGFSRKEIAAMYNDIVEFAELQKFMDQKLKNYSSGMQVRLAFSIAIRAQGDILLLDEVLAVGDATFQQKCYNYFKELKRNKKTVILVSHDSGALEKYCDRGILIEKGKIITMDSITHVLNTYNQILVEGEEKKNSQGAESQKTVNKNRWGTREIEVVTAKTLNGKKGNAQTVFGDDDQNIGLRVQYIAHASKERPVYGVTITDAAGERIFVSNTEWSRVSTKNVGAGKKVEVYWNIPNVFSDGEYAVTPAVASSTDFSQYDSREAFIKFKVKKALPSSAIINVDHTIEIKE